MELNEGLQKRRSIRKYTGEEVSHTQLAEIVKAAQMAPSWKHSQVSRYYIAHSPQARAKVAEYLPEFNQNRTKGAAAYIVTAVVGGISGFQADGTPATHIGDGFQYFDNGLAVENLCLAAYDAGLGTLIMGLYNEAGLREYFQVPDSETIVAVLAVGYAESQVEAKPRKELDEVAKFF